MPAKSLDPLRKVTIDLFEADVKYLQAKYPNFSECVRDLIHTRVLAQKTTAAHDAFRRSLKDLPHGR